MLNISIPAKAQSDNAFSPTALPLFTDPPTNNIPTTTDIPSPSIDTTSTTPFSGSPPPPAPPPFSGTPPPPAPPPFSGTTQQPANVPPPPTITSTQYIKCVIENPDKDISGDIWKFEAITEFDPGVECYGSTPNEEGNDESDFPTSKTEGYDPNYHLIPCGATDFALEPGYPHPEEFNPAPNNVSEVVLSATLEYKINCLCMAKVNPENNGLCPLGLIPDPSLCPNPVTYAGRILEARFTTKVPLKIPITKEAYLSAHSKLLTKLDNLADIAGSGYCSGSDIPSYKVDPNTNAWIIEENALTYCKKNIPAAVTPKKALKCVSPTPIPLPTAYPTPTPDVIPLPTAYPMPTPEPPPLPSEINQPKLEDPSAPLPLNYY